MPFHQDLFKGRTLFDKIARSVCLAGTLPRKELYESWETARRVRRKFRGGRVVDMACGHGLLAHIMLILDNSSSCAVAVDQSIPLNAGKMAEALVNTWPRLEGRIQYRETKIEDLVLLPEDIIVSAHACGALTDRVLEKAMEVRTRVAVLPCCHDVKNCRTMGMEGWMDAALAIDAARAFRLASAGYHVITQTIPGDITPKNRLLLAEPLGFKKRQLF